MTFIRGVKLTAHGPNPAKPGVWHSWPVSVISSQSWTHHELGGTVQLHGAGALKKNQHRLKWDHKMGGNVCSSRASGYYWPVGSCCAPVRCPCSPGASCISRCWSQNDSWREDQHRVSHVSVCQPFVTEAWLLRTLARHHHHKSMGLIGGRKTCLTYWKASTLSL